MRFFIFLIFSTLNTLIGTTVFIQLFLHPVFAQQTANNSEIIAPVLIKSEKSDEAQFGVFTTEPTEQRLDALTIIRQELQRQALHEQSKAQKDGVFMNVNKRFTPESITFFIAIGGVTFNSMWIKSHGDPLAMERHILSLKDPIAHLSFYAFMQAQGFYMNWQTKKPGFNSMDAVTKRRTMVRLSYQGMAIGSLAASIVADLGQSAKMCVDKWIKGKTDETSLESCNQAWKQWTARGKFTQYFPQIISLWVAQAATSLTETSIHKAFHKVTLTSFAKKILNKEFLVNTAYKITGADVVLTFTGGGWVIKGIKFAGKLTKFSLFVGVDHLLANYTYRPLNNLIRPIFFNFDVSNINTYWQEADQKGYWNESEIKNPEALEKFEKEIENYGVQMQQWREHLNADVEIDLAGWMEMTKKILQQIDYAYQYYQGFASHMFKTMNINHRIEKAELSPSAATIISGYPFRTLPFYGVSTGKYQPISGKIEDVYLLSPNEIEKIQREHILNTVEKYKNLHHEVTKKFRASELKEFNSLIEKLSSKDDLKISSGLNDLNSIITELKPTYVAAIGTWEANSIYSFDFQGAVHELKKELGNPQPVVYPFAGYSQAFAAYSANQVSATAADYGKWSVVNKFKFNKEADLMLYKIICGAQQSSLSKIALAGVNFVSPQFDPPSLLKPNNDRNDFCNSLISTNTLYSTNIANKSLKDYILQNLNYEALGDYKNLKNTENTAAFEKWWLKNGTMPLDAEFKKFDLQYKAVYELAHNNYFNNRSYFKMVADSLNQSQYLPKSIDASLKAETHLYLQLLSSVLTTDNPFYRGEESGNSSAPARFQQPVVFDYVEFATRNSKKSNYVSLYKNPIAEIEKLNTLLNEYAGFIKPTARSTKENTNNTDFDNYIAHSKKIDTAINDILVLLGLKKLIKTESSASVDDLSILESSVSASGNENSDNVYEDVAITTPTHGQRMAIAAIRGLRQVESEVRRFIRMKMLLSQSLELDTKEFAEDWSNANP